jgi:hypothetical protein
MLLLLLLLRGGRSASADAFWGHYPLQINSFSLISLPLFFCN